MIESFRPEQKQETQKKVAFITEEGSPKHDFAVCFLIEKGEEAIIYSPGDNSYEVKHNVGKRVTLTALYPAEKGARKWIAKAAPLQLLPENLRSEIVTPASQIAQTVKNKTAKLSETEQKFIDKEAEMLLPKRLSFSISASNYLYLKSYALDNGLTGRYATSIILNEALAFAFNNGFLRD